MSIPNEVRMGNGMPLWWKEEVCMLMDIIIAVIFTVWIVVFWIVNERRDKTERERNKQVELLWQAIELHRREIVKEREQHE